MESQFQVAFTLRRREDFFSGILFAMKFILISFLYLFSTLNYKRFSSVRKASKIFCSWMSSHIFERLFLGNHV